MYRGVGNVGDAFREKDGRVERSRVEGLLWKYRGQNDELIIALDAIDVCYDDGLDDSRTADVTAHAPSHNLRSNDVELIWSFRNVTDSQDVPSAMQTLNRFRVCSLMGPSHVLNITLVSVTTYTPDVWQMNLTTIITTDASQLQVS